MAASQTDLSRRGRSAHGLPPPSGADLRRFYENAQEQSAGFRQRAELVARVRAKKHEVPVPKRYEGTTAAVKTHFIGDILRRANAHLGLNYPTVRVPPMGESPDDLANATRREEFTTAALLQMDAERMPKRPWPWSIDYSTSFGGAAYKLVYLPDAWHDYPTARQIAGKAAAALDEDERRRVRRQQDDYKKGRLPFSWRAIDPRSYWYWQSEGQLTDVIEWSLRSVRQLRQQYNLGLDPWSGRVFDPRQFSEAYRPDDRPSDSESYKLVLEHWDREWATYYLPDDDVVLKQWRHGYPRVPYFPWIGLANATASPGQEMESLVEHILDIARLYDELLTMWKNWAHLSAYPSQVLEGDKDARQIQLATEADGAGDDQLGPDFEWEAGTSKVMPRGWKHRWIEAPPVGADLIRVSEVLVGFIMEVIPNILKGVAPSDQAGYAIAQLTTAARIVFDPITENIALALQEMVRLMWWLIVHKIREPVFVNYEPTSVGKRAASWVELGPKDIGRYYGVRVSVRPLLPSTRISDGQFGLQQWKGGAIPWRMHLEEFVHAENPDKLMREYLVEQELYNPQGRMYRWSVDRAIEKAGMKDRMEEEQRKAALAALPMPPGIQEELALRNAGGGMEGVPGVPAPQSLAPQPGIGMPLQAPVPPAGGLVATGGMPLQAPAGGDSGMPPGRAAGVERQPPVV